MNPLIEMIAKQANTQLPGMDMLQKFGEFKRNWTPEGASAKISEMLRTGQISMQQYEQARQMAEKVSQLMR